MLVRCEGGPAIARAVRFPPPLEIDVEQGTYVLVDDGPPEHWCYAFLPLGSDPGATLDRGTARRLRP
jgi:hypothetical protein